MSSYLIRVYDTTKRKEISIAVSVNVRNINTKLVKLINAKGLITRKDDEWMNYVVLNSVDFIYRVRHIAKIHEIRTIKYDGMNMDNLLV